jgi:hypothetical protein
MRDGFAGGLMQRRRQVLQQTALEQLVQIDERIDRLQCMLHGSWRSGDLDIAVWRESLRPVQATVAQLVSRIALRGEADAADCAQLSAARRMLTGLEIEARAIVIMRVPAEPALAEHRRTEPQREHAAA